MKYLTQKEASAIDEALLNISQGGYLNEQLMELAGLAVAQTIVKLYPNAKNILTITGMCNKTAAQYMPS